MYLRTPKRYSPKRKRRRLFSLKWLPLYLLAPLIILGGSVIYNQRDQIAPLVDEYLQSQMQRAQDTIATSQAPTPTATASPYNYLNIANAAYERGAMDEAIENYKLTIGGLPNDVGVHFQLVHLLITNDRINEAVEYAEQAVNADPYNPLGWAIQGMAYDWAGQIDKALPSLYQALELDPTNATALSFLAETYIDSGKGFEAVELIEQALELEPTNYNVQRNFGYVSQWTGDPDSAQQAYERALQLAPNRTYIISELVDIYKSNGDFDEAVSLLQNTIDRNPENAGAYAALAELYLGSLGEQGLAREAAERCVSIAPENVGCLFMLGSLQRVEAEYNLCARTLERAINAGSTYSLTYLYAGTCYIVINDCTRAREVLMEGLQYASTVETQTDFRDALAQCQIVVTLVPSATPEGFGATPTPEP